MTETNQVLITEDRLLWHRKILLECLGITEQDIVMMNDLRDEDDPPGIGQQNAARALAWIEAGSQVVDGDIIRRIEEDLHILRASHGNCFQATL